MFSERFSAVRAIVAGLAAVAVALALLCTVVWIAGPREAWTAWTAFAGVGFGFAGVAVALVAARSHFDAVERLRVDCRVGRLVPPPQVAAGGREAAALRVAVEAAVADAAATRSLPEERLAAILAALPVAVVVITESGLVSLVNGAARGLFGERAITIGTSIFDALRRADLGRALSAAALDGSPAEAQLSAIDGRVLRAVVARLGRHSGAVLCFGAAEPGRAAAVVHDLSLHDTPPAAAAPGDGTPLADLPVLVFDLETTGLDVRSDDVVAVGGVRMHGSAIFRAATLDRIVNPGRPIPARSTAIHGIDDAMVAHAPTFAEVWPEIEPHLDKAVLVGHNVAFDAAHLRRAARLSGCHLPPLRTLDTVLLSAALDPRENDLRLEAVARRLGVDVLGRHTALGDSLVTAEVFARLIPLLADRGVRTLREAERFQSRARALVRAQRRAGWLTAPDARSEIGRAD